MALYTMSFMASLQAQLQTFMDEKIVAIDSTQPALHMLLRFQRWAELNRAAA